MKQNLYQTKICKTYLYIFVDYKTFYYNLCHSKACHNSLVQGWCSNVSVLGSPRHIPGCILSIRTTLSTHRQSLNEYLIFEISCTTHAKSHNLYQVCKQAVNKLCLHGYTRKNAQVVTSLQTRCNKSVHKLSTSCVRTACS